jgi:hypothetical protein
MSLYDVLRAIASHEFSSDELDLMISDLEAANAPAAPVDAAPAQPVVDAPQPA